MIRPPHESSPNSTRRWTLRSVAILTPPLNLNRKVPERDPPNLKTSHWLGPREKKQILCPNKVNPRRHRKPLPDWRNIEVSDILRSALLQSIATTLSKLPQSSFPISPSVFSEAYLLPFRPFKEVSATSTPVDIKHSGYKSLTSFLKASAKEGLIKLKETKGEVVVTGTQRLVRVLFLLKHYAGVDQSHSSVGGHSSHITVKDVEEKKERKEERERQEEHKAKEKEREFQITLFWKPHAGNVGFFKEAGRE
jgi:hypothetical protein